LLADQCPEITIAAPSSDGVTPPDPLKATITSLVPLKVTPPAGWKVTTHEIDIASTSYHVSALQEHVRMTMYEIDEATRSATEEAARYAKDYPESPQPELQLQDVAPFEYHVLTENVDNVNKANTISLHSCQYGLLWTKYNRPLYYKEREGTGEWGGRALRGWKNLTCIDRFTCMDKYYYLYHSLIELTPISTITIDVSSILDNNYTGWTKTRYGGFDCNHDHITDPKCTWVAGAPPPPKAPFFNPDSQTKPSIINLLP